MEKPNKLVFRIGLLVSTAIRATEMVYPEHQRICDACLIMRSYHQYGWDYFCQVCAAF